MEVKGWFPHVFSTQTKALPDQSPGPQGEAGITHGPEQPSAAKGGGARYQIGRMEEEGRKGLRSHLQGSREPEGRSPISLSEQFPLYEEVMTLLHCPEVSTCLLGTAKSCRGGRASPALGFSGEERPGLGLGLGSHFLCDSPAPSGHHSPIKRNLGPRGTLGIGLGSWRLEKRGHVISPYCVWCSIYVISLILTERHDVGSISTHKIREWLEHTDRSASMEESAGKINKRQGKRSLEDLHKMVSEDPGGREIWDSASRAPFPSHTPLLPLKF